MKFSIASATIVLAALLSGCGDGGSSQPSSENSTLSVWQEAGAMMGLDAANAERRITTVLASHNTVASDANVKDLVGAMLRFRDSNGVELDRQLSCMESGVKSPSGGQWQDTLAWCVVELS